MKKVFAIFAVVFLLSNISSGSGIEKESGSIIKDGNRAYFSLNGEWDVLPIKGLKFNYPPPQDGWKKEMVPNKSGCTRTIKSGPYIVFKGNDPLKTGKIEKKDGMASWFKHEFKLPAQLPANKKVVLYFDGIAFRSETWLNGKKLGTSYQCAVPVEYGVTGIVKPGKNELVVGITGLEGITDVENKTIMTPAAGMLAGIRHNVELRFLPQVYIDDIFVKTSVKNKKIDVDLTICNSGKESVETSPEATVFNSDGIPQLSISGKKITLKAGETKTVTLSKDWKNPSLWDINNPVLYKLRTTLSSNGKEIDQKNETFGFREFEIRGKDFYLNGVRTVLFRKSNLSQLGSTPETSALFKDIRGKTGNPYNCVRLHLGFNNKYQLDAADQCGMMTIPESSWNWVRKYPADKKHIWLPNTLEYYRKWIKRHRNRPSVIMWSLCNETYWDKRIPEDMEIAKQILAVAKECDPTRPQQGDGEVSWNGILPTINIHYPEGTAGTLKNTYPNSNIIVPNDLHWLKKKGENSSWRAKFVWDRPLMLGEYWWAAGDVNCHSSFIGDDAFDWEKWRLQKFSDPSFSPNNRYIETLQKATDYYRMMGVACLNPWAGDRKLFMKAIDVRPLEFHPNFFAGEVGKRKVIVFNDTPNNYYKLHLLCDLKVNGTTVWHDKINVNAPKGTHKQIDIPIDFPQVSKPTEAELIVRLFYWRAGGFRELSRYKENLYLTPKTNLHEINSNKIALFDSSGETEKALASLGMKIKAEKTLAAKTLENKKLLIVGQDSSVSEYAKLLEKFVNDGGKVIILRQKDWKPLINELPENDPKHATSQSWTRSFEHPILSETYEKQFSYWRPDNLIGIENYWKPSNGKFEILLDCGGRYGMCWSPLLTVPYGQGEFILCQLNVISGIKEEPMAAFLLKNMIKHALETKKTNSLPLRTIAGKNTALKDSLKAQSVVFTESIDGDGPILLDASAEITPKIKQAIATNLKNGDFVWLHGFTPETINKLEGILPFKPELEVPDKTVKSAVRRTKDPLINSLASFDFFWTSIDMGARADYFQKSKPTAKLGDFVMKINNLAAAKPLLNPAFFVKIPVDKGNVLFDTLQWEKAIGFESDKVGRLISAIVTNIGGDIKLKPEKQYQYSFVDLKPFANMGFYDKVAGDEKGGWTDQGQNDMRFFLINHTGKAGGLEDGMDVSTDKFPSKARFAKRPYSLIVPAENNGKSVISLRGQEHGEFLPTNMKNIAVNMKADMLWFLQTGCWIQVTKQNMEKMAEYVIHYDDGSSVTFPIRIGMEIGDWWNPTPMPKSTVAWTGMNLKHSPIGIWSTPWENPFPDKKIKSIDLNGNFQPSQLVLLAITGGVEVGEKKK